ncbi:hypothetical protein WMY93_034135 [Mugilogobius chulae]|uniref:CCHC-type domain-containing protein n=1 Tax=Mugilogobius chulae TaxID=88201 RepID=A0AAW0MQU6_9GOBI
MRFLRCSGGICQALSREVNTRQINSCGRSQFKSSGLEPDQLKQVRKTRTPAYIKDEEIEGKLLFWGVTPVSEVRRRMWPGTTVADGTRYVKVRFTDAVRSLPYSVRFDTAAGPEYFRVIHDRQVRVCRGCLQPDHILRECPDFLCRNCGEQGHYARECDRPRAQKCRDCRMFRHLCICEDDSGSQQGEVQGGEDTQGEQTEESECAPQETCDPVTEPPCSELSQISAVSSLIPSVDEASGQEEAVEPSRTGSSSTQREGTCEGATSKAAVGTAELGRGMDAGPDLHLTLEGERQGTVAAQHSKLEGTNERGRSVSKRNEVKTLFVKSAKDQASPNITKAAPETPKGKSPARSSLPVPTAKSSDTSSFND